MNIHEYQAKELLRAEGVPIPGILTTGARGPIILLGIAVTAVVLGFFAVDTLRNAPETFAAIVAIAALAVVLDAAWKHFRHELPPPTAEAQLTPSGGA